MAKSDMTQLNCVESIELKATQPFSFRYSTWKPSHFPTQLERHSMHKTWRTFRLKDGTPLGVVLQPLPPYVDGAAAGIIGQIYSHEPLRDSQRSELIGRLRRSYGLDLDLSEFYAVAKTSPSLASSLVHLHGMRPSCPESMFEILVISLILQNTTVARSAQMLSNLLAHYGDKIEFAGATLYVFCDASRVMAATQEELRGACRLGYRAKYLPDMARGFTTGLVDEDLMRTVSAEQAQAELMKLKGVGPYSAFTILASSLQAPDAVNLDSWNTKIISRNLFGRDDAGKDQVTAELTKLFGRYRGWAALYIVEDEYRSHPVSPIVQE